MWGFQMIVWQDEDVCVGMQFDFGDGVVFFVEQEGGDLEGYVGVDFCGVVFQGFFFDQVQDGQ